MPVAETSSSISQTHFPGNKFNTCRRRVRILGLLLLQQHNDLFLCYSNIVETGLIQINHSHFMPPSKTTNLTMQYNKKHNTNAKKRAQTETCSLQMRKKYYKIKKNKKKNQKQRETRGSDN